MEVFTFENLTHLGEKEGFYFYALPKEKIELTSSIFKMALDAYDEWEGCSTNFLVIVAQNEQERQHSFLSHHSSLKYGLGCMITLMI